MMGIDPTCRTELVWTARRLFRDTSADFADCLIERRLQCGLPTDHDVRSRSGQAPRHDLGSMS
jgi:hypothetical protein